MSSELEPLRLELELRSECGKMCALPCFAHLVQTCVHLSLVQSVNTNSVYILIPAAHGSTYLPSYRRG